MRPRHAISDEDWSLIELQLPCRPDSPGRDARGNRLFVDAVLWVGKTGAPWRDLPERFGSWNTVWKRFDRRSRKGVWQRVFGALQNPDLDWLILDSTAVRAHQHAAGAQKTATASRRTRRWAAAGATSARRSTSG